MMNIRRGLFRLWLVAAALFALFVGVIAYDEVRVQFGQPSLQKFLDENKGHELVLPVLCGEARGKIGTDFGTRETVNPGPWDLHTKVNASETCYYGMSKFRLLYPEYNDLPDEVLARRLYERAGRLLKDLPNPWSTLAMWAGIAIGIPLAVLALGAALVWAFAGFAGSRPARP